MSKKGIKSEDIIEAICDDKVITAFSSKLQEKLSHDLFTKLEQKLDGMMTEIKNNLKSTIEQESKKILKDALSPCYQKIASQDERINSLETKLIQNDLMICGLKLKTKNNEEQSMPRSDQIKEELIEHLNMNLDLKIGANEIIYAYSTKKPMNESNPPPIIVSFSSYALKQEILTKAKEKKKSSSTYTRVFYNERLTKFNSEIFFRSRVLHRNNKIFACWSFRGEVYIRKDNTSKPHKISKLSDLELYN